MKRDPTEKNVENRLTFTTGPLADIGGGGAWGA